MMDTLWRLVWALPLVLLTGVGAVLVLKRIVVPARPPDPGTRRLTLREALSVSDDTRVYLIEFDRQTYLLVESARGTVLQPASPKTETAHPRPVLGPPWAQRLFKGVLR